MQVYCLVFKLASPELRFNDNWNKMAKSDGKDIKPIISATTETLNPTLPHIDTDDTDPDEDEDNGQSWHEVLDPELQPEQPIPDNQESQEIYADHTRLAKEYLRVETKLYFSRELKEKILQQMDPEEQREKQELLQKLKEKEDLLVLYNDLKASRQNMLQMSEEPVDGWVMVNNNNPNS